MTPVALVRGAVKRYGSVLALDAVDFVLQPGQVCALLGKNGAGKSTLIRLLSGVEAADEGQVLIDGTPVQPGRRPAGVQVVYQELSLVPQLSVAENLFLGNWLPGRIGLDVAGMHREARELLDRVGLTGLDSGRWVSSLSPAQRQLVEIARALRGQPRLVILDEPTSSLTERESQRVLAIVKRIAAEGIAVIYVSHRMKEIRAVASMAMVMRDGRASGPHDLAALDDQQIVSLMLGSVHRVPHSAPVAGAQGQGNALSLRGLRLAPKLQGIDLDLRRGEVLGIAGLLGSGRTELLRALAGIDAADAGELRIGEGAPLQRWRYAQLLAQGLGFTPESRKEDGIFAQLGVDENIVLSDLSRVSRGIATQPSRIRAAARAVMLSMSLKAASPQAGMATLSGGNQQKAVIGRWVHADSTMLLLDEPTRGVDVEAKFQIYEIMRGLVAQGRSVVFVSSELEELPLVCDRVLVLREGRIAEELSGATLTLRHLVAACMFEADAAAHPPTEETQAAPDDALARSLS